MTKLQREMVGEDGTQDDMVYLDKPSINPLIFEKRTRSTTTHTKAYVYSKLKSVDLRTMKVL